MSEDLPDIESFTDRVLFLVDEIPSGSVSTYGQIATYAGAHGAARAVGNILRGRGEHVAWHRVINAKGEISIRGDLLRPMIQRELLEDEGIEFSLSHRCRLSDYLWEPKHLYWA